MACRGVIVEVISVHKDRFAAYGKKDKQSAEVKKAVSCLIYFATYTLCSPVSFGEEELC